jgi:hypothetical protein
LQAVVCIVLSEMSGTGSRELNSPLQLLRTSLVVVGVLFVADNLGFQVQSLVAGISIAGRVGTHSQGCQIGYTCT